jgi:DNA-binding NtrC family response regulator
MVMELQAGNIKTRERFKTIAEVEKEHIEKVYIAAGKNKTLAARWLGIGRATMYRKMAEYGIDKKKAMIPPPQY